MTEKKVTLYYANWCGHCQRFKPTWEALKGFFDQNGVAHEEYEDGKNPKEIREAGIKAFPTLKIKVGKNEEDYHGSMTPNDIVHTVLPNIQLGGSYHNYNKYLKYRHKYLKLKKQLGGN